MSMTTPRVTVPVERAEYERLISVTEDLIREVSDPGTEALAAVYCARRILDQSAMLSAAPAPEGGAVSTGAWDVVQRVSKLTVAGGDPLQDPAFAQYPAIADLVAKAQAALATREEAPAEDDARRKLIQCIEQWDGETEYDADDLTSLADSILHAFNGPPVVLRADPVQLSSNPCQLAVATSSEASPCPFCGCGMRVNYDPESEMYGPDGDHLPGCIIGNWDLHEYAFRPDALAAWNSRALRAQPQAREDAGVELVSNGYKFDEEIAWLREASRYFAARETKGEDRAHWANVYNAENARKLADRLAELSSNPCQLAVATSSEASPCPFCGCGMRVNYDPESEMYGPDGDHLPGCIIGNWDLHEYAFRPDALAAWNSRALRAQPQAREDAQPVAWRRALSPIDGHFTYSNVGDEGWEPLYTHPAPDALPSTEKVMDAIKDGIEHAAEMNKANGPMVIRADPIRCAAGAVLHYLAALQAEQGAK